MRIFKLSLLFFFIFYAIGAQTRYVDTVFDAVEVRTFNYAIKNSDTLKLDIYQPVGDTLSKKPLIALVHGGGFYSGTRNDSYMVAMAKNMAKKGYNVASIDYQLAINNKEVSCHVPKDDIFKYYKRAAQNVLDALLFLTDYKTDFEIDASKIILIGSSAGAETVLNITYNRPLISTTSRHQSVKIATVISISGAIFDTNLIGMNNNIPGVFYHGDKDPIVPYGKGAHHSCTPIQNGYFILEGSKNITEKLDNLNTNFLMYTYKDRGHDIFNLPYTDFHQAFIFINNVLFANEFYQARIKKNL